MIGRGKRNYPCSSHVEALAKATHKYSLAVRVAQYYTDVKGNNGSTVASEPRIFARWPDIVPLSGEYQCAQDPRYLTQSCMCFSHDTPPKVPFFFSKNANRCKVCYISYTVRYPVDGYYREFHQYMMLSEWQTLTTSPFASRVSNDEKLLAGVGMCSRTF